MTNLNFNQLKETDAIWLPQIPKHWEFIKVRHLFKESTKKGFPNETLLVASQEHGVVSKDIYGKRTVEATKDLHNLKLVEQGDFVISLRSFQGGIELAHERGIISPAYTILKETQPINNRYFKNLFKSSPFISLMTLCLKGIREGQNIDYPTFKNEYLPVPPIEEQSIISEYLDKKNSEIDKFIENKEKLIALLEEQKTTFISNTVKNDLIKIPDHWSKSKLKYVTTKIGDGLHGTPEYVVNSDYYFINGNNLISGMIELGRSAKEISENEFKKHQKELGENTILYSINGTIGNIAFYRGEKVALGKSAAYINCNKKLSREYLFYLLQSKIVTDFYITEMNGTTIFNLSLHSLKNTPITIPPKKEQENIVKNINDGVSKINLAISKAQKEIAAIKEYREALITDLVTGKRSIPQS